MLRRTFMGCILGLGMALAELYAPHRPWIVAPTNKPHLCVWTGNGIPGEWLDRKNWIGGRVATTGDSVIFGGACEVIVPQEVERLERVTVLDTARVRVGFEHLDRIEADAWRTATNLAWDDM